MLDEKISKAVKNYYKIQKDYYGIKKPKKPHINRYRYYLEKLDKIGNIDYIHYNGTYDECIDIYYNEDLIFHIFHDGSCMVVCEGRATGGPFDICSKILETELTS